VGGREAAVLDGVCSEARAAGVRAEPWIADLDLGPCSLPAGLPPLRGFVFAAGATEDAALAALSLDRWERAWRINAGSHAALLRGLALPGRLAPGARGLLIGSLSGSRGNAGQAAYAAAKGSLEDLLALAPGGLRLNVLLPPLMPSPMLDGLGPAARASLFAARLMDDPEPAAGCAEAAAFLLSDGASYVHRQVLHADTRVSALGWD